jgi:hypothetical protein
MFLIRESLLAMARLACSVFRFFIPEDSTLPWVRNFYGELAVWTGMPKETADQVDITSYAAYVNKRQVSTWGGTIKGR